MARSRAAAYRHPAQGCLRLADVMTSPEHRAVLVSMARALHWRFTQFLDRFLRTVLAYGHGCKLIN
jgi:hypothetical protein